MERRHRTNVAAIMGMGGGASPLNRNPGARRHGRVRVVVLPVQNFRQPMADIAVDAIFLGLVEYFMPPAADAPTGVRRRRSVLN
jgi:hypothetical protein